MSVNPPRGDVKEQLDPKSGAQESPRLESRLWAVVQGVDGVGGHPGGMWVGKERGPRTQLWASE